jgi:hypothetical protein
VTQESRVSAPSNVLQVPLFVETGDELKVDAREAKYISRAE